MEDKRKIAQYYKRLMYGGRSRVARAVDFVALRAVLLLACYLWFSTLVENTVVAWVLAVLTLAVLSVAAQLAKSMRLEKLIKRERARIAREVVCQRLMLMSRKDYCALVHDFVRLHPDDYPKDCLVYPLRRAAPLTEDDMALICRTARLKGQKEVAIFALSEPSDAALSALKLYFPDNPPWFEKDRLLSHVLSVATPTEQELDEVILAKLAAQTTRKKQIFKEPFKAGRLKRYLITAAVLAAMSFFMEYALYYRLMAAVCLGMGALSWWLNRLSAQERQET